MNSVSESVLDCERDDDWTACVDFGTAASKAAMMARVPRNVLKSEHFAPLMLTPSSYLAPSLVLITADRVRFAAAAEAAAKAEGAAAVKSLKRYLTMKEPDEIDEPLPSALDPTGSYSARDAMELFLAHLLKCAGDYAVAKGLPWPVRLRIARPAWSIVRATLGETMIKSMVANAFALIDVLEDDLTAPDGLGHAAARDALRIARARPKPADKDIFQLDRQGRATVLEATAAAAGAIKTTGRRVVAVADIGGGTSDFGAFMTGRPKHFVVADVDGSSSALREAGDHLDALLVDMLLAAAEVDREDPDAAEEIAALRKRDRALKERLFSRGAVTEEIDEEVVTVTLEAFLASPGVQEFTRKLQKHFRRTLSEAVACARSHSDPKAKRAPVEVLLSGGGHALPMVRDLLQTPADGWPLMEIAPEFIEKSGLDDLKAVARQMVVAIGGALYRLPAVSAPVTLTASGAPASGRRRQSAAAAASVSMRAR